jgi:thymidine kinase
LGVRPLIDGPAVAKLYFRYGTMDSAKSMNLLAVAHNYRKQGKRVVLMKPRLDTRFGTETISSRSGLEATADVMIDEDSRLDPRDFAGLDCVLVDEAQFLPPSVIDDLRRITVDPGVPVICYGLRTDFKTKLFPGAQRLMELADGIEEVKVTCQYCQRKAICNLRFVNGAPTVEGPQIQLGAEESYAPVCWAHYDEATKQISAEVSGAVIRPS